MAARHEKGCYETYRNIFSCLLRRTMISNGDVGVARGTIFPEIRPELVSKSAVSLKKSWGGYHRRAILGQQLEPWQQENFELIC